MRNLIAALMLVIVTSGCEKQHSKDYNDVMRLDTQFNLQIDSANLYCDSMKFSLKDSSSFNKYKIQGLGHLRKAKYINNRMDTIISKGNCNNPIHKMK